MPLLPTQNMNTNVADLGQGPSIARSSQVWDAVAKVGDGVLNFSSELAAKRKQAETTSYITQNSNELERAVSDKETELAAKYTGDPTGASSEMNEFINSWYEEKSQNAPNDDAKALWEQKFADHSNTIGMRADAWENKKRAEWQVGQQDDSTRKDAQHLALKPDPVKAAQFMANNAEMVKSGVGLWYNETEAKDRVNKNGATIAKSLMEGLEANKQYSQGLNIFEGKDPNAKIILSNMTPEQIGSYKDRFQKLSQAEAEVSKHALNMKANDVQSAYMQGMNVPDESFQSLVSQSASLKPEDRAVFLDNLKVSKTYGDVLSGMKKLPVEELDKYAGFSINHGQDIFNLSSRTKLSEEYQKAAAKIIDQRKNSPSDFWASNDQDVKMASMAAMDPKNTGAMDAYSKLISAKKLADKSSSTQVLTTEMSKNYSTLLKANNPQAANTFRNSLEAGFGSNFGNVVSDMVKNGHITEDFAMAMHLNDEASRESAFSSIINKKAIDSAYETRADKVKGEESDIFTDPEVMSIKQAITANSGSAKDLWANNGLDSIVKLEFKNARVNGMSFEDAKKAAIKKVVSSNFSVATSGKSSIPLMGKYKDMRSDAEDFMDTASSTTVLSQLNLQTPKSYLDHGQLTDKAPAEMHSRYLTELSQNGKWILNDAQNGLKLIKVNPNGKMSLPVDADGKPVEVKFEDMKGFMTKANEKRISQIDRIRKTGL